jgi:uncharacterized protein YggL (DUF469 family)
MRKLSFIFLFALGLQLSASPDSTGVAHLIDELGLEMEMTMARYEAKHQSLFREYSELEARLEKRPHKPEEYMQLLHNRMTLMEAMKREEELLGVELTKLRYKKGLDLIRLLYEKVLGLDHHFSSIQTYQNIMSLSNPNAYPEFQRSKALVEKRLKKENQLQLPNILESNPYLSPAFSLITSVLAAGNTREKENELENISCILDFTARMNSELATIYYETAFLKESNESLKEACIHLFEEYVGVIDYHTPLDICRREDEWEEVEESLDQYIVNLEEQIAHDPQSSRAIKDQINLEFAVDRLINFINKYNGFIAQGSKYYQKFEVIVSNYPNEENCKAKLPVEFDSLKKDINYSIERFNEAYNIAALKGSKLKDLLYGFSD